ncbi:tyrosine-type recombinase/integrase [Ruegeria atlantica]|uniref:Putative prophage CPS-53 integrase n=1 Tax=Ruegeria atlantica TaxID=81569 RepID=A0A0P1E3F8_9RHOB|nr:tyrosine-type recombinase/integrase [Ruegeria atlantica]CUH41561.1 Putative prophage CPS-53 integrase [Ruegeria atlantica]
MRWPVSSIPGEQSPLCNSGVADAAYAARAPRMKGAKAEQWLTSLERHMGPLWSRPVTELTAPVLMEHLTPLVRTRTESARKAVGRISIVFKQAEAMGIPVSNPAPALRAALPWPKRSKRHHAAVTLEAAPAAFQRILQTDTTSAAVLAVTILTGARCGTIRHMRSDWVSGDVYTAPGEVMKMDQPHAYPLTPVALGLVRRWSEAGDPVVFASRAGGALSDMAVLKLQKQIVPNTTVHGWRSVLTDWLRESEHADDDLINATLAHSSKAARAAYARSSLVDRRRDILEKWESYLLPGGLGSMAKYI